MCGSGGEAALAAAGGGGRRCGDGHRRCYGCIQAGEAVVELGGEEIRADPRGRGGGKGGWGR